MLRFMFAAAFRISSKDRQADWALGNSLHKGQKACAKAVINAVQAGEPALILFEEIMEESCISIELAEGQN